MSFQITNKFHFLGKNSSSLSIIPNCSGYLISTSSVYTTVRMPLLYVIKCSVKLVLPIHLDSSTCNF